MDGTTTEPKYRRLTLLQKLKLEGYLVRVFDAAPPGQFDGPTLARMASEDLGFALSVSMIHHHIRQTGRKLPRKHTEPKEGGWVERELIVAMARWLLTLQSNWNTTKPQECRDIGLTAQAATVAVFLAELAELEGGQAVAND